MSASLLFEVKASSKNRNVNGQDETKCKAHNRKQ